jgi:hypothetical protein
MSRCSRVHGTDGALSIAKASSATVADAMDRPVGIRENARGSSAYAFLGFNGHLSWSGVIAGGYLHCDPSVAYLQQPPGNGNAEYLNQLRLWKASTK